MKKLFFSSAFLFGALQAFTQVRPLMDLQKREMLAPAAVKTRLAQVRENIKLKNLSYTVGYTEVFDMDYRKLASGLKVVINHEEMVRQNMAADAKLKQNDMVFQKSILELTGYQPSEILYNSYSTFDWRDKGVMTPVKSQAPAAVAGHLEVLVLTRPAINY